MIQEILFKIHLKLITNELYINLKIPKIYIIVKVVILYLYICKKYTHVYTHRYVISISHFFDTPCINLCWPGTSEFFS